MVQPNFFICGAGRSGTTSLYHYLDQHPDICMSLEKETRFFSDPKYYDKGLNWLQQFYSHYSGETAIGEGDPGIMPKFGSPERVSQVSPDARLLFIIRNPVEYLHAVYHFGVQIGIYDCPSRTFSEFIREEENKWTRQCLRTAAYVTHFERFNKYFQKDKFKIILFGNFVGETVNAVKGVYNFLGVDDRFTPSMEQHNATRHTRHPKLFRFAYRVWRPVERYLDDSIIEKTTFLRESMRSFFFDDEVKRPDMSRRDRQYLEEYYYQPDRRLERWLGRELPDHWP